MGRLCSASLFPFPFQGPPPILSRLRQPGKRVAVGFFREDGLRELLPLEPQKLIDEVKAEIQRVEEEAAATGESAGLLKKKATKAGVLCFSVCVFFVFPFFF